MSAEKSISEIDVKHTNGYDITGEDEKKLRDSAQKYLDTQKKSLPLDQYNALHAEIVAFLGKVDTDFSQMEARFESIKNKITAKNHTQLTELKKEVDVVVFMDEALRLINDEVALKKHLDMLDGKIDQSSKDKLLSDIATQRDMLIQSDISYMRKDRNLIKLQKNIEGLRLRGSDSTVPVSNIQSVTLAPAKSIEPVVTPISSSVHILLNHGTMGYAESHKAYENLTDEQKKTLAIPQGGSTSKPAETTPTSPRTSIEDKNADKYNKAFYKTNKSRFEAVTTAINTSKDEKVKKLTNSINAYMEDQNADTASQIQSILNTDFSKDLNPDNKVGPNTLGALEQIVGIESPAIVASVKRAGAPKSKNTQEVAPAKKPGMKTEKDGNPKIEVLNNTTTQAVFKEGAFYLTGPKGRPTRVDYNTLASTLNLPKDAPENLQKSVGLVNDYALILDAYIVKYPERKKQYEESIKEIQTKFADPAIQSGVNMLSLDSAIDKLPKGFQDGLKPMFMIVDPKARGATIAHYIRYSLDQHDMAAANIMQRRGAEFQINDTELMKGTIGDSLKLNPSQNQKVDNTIEDAKIEAAKNWKEHKKKYIETFKKQNPTITLTEEILSKAETGNRELTILAMAKREIFYQKLYNTDQKDPELKILKEILGASTWSMSDRAKDLSGEVAGMIAIEAIAIAAGVVTAGVATAAINAAMLGRNAYRGVRAIEAYNAASKTRKVVTTAGRILGSGAAFEAGAATTRGLIENGDWSSMHSKEGYVQSIAMMGALSGINKLILSEKFGTKAIQFKEGAGFTKNVLPFVGQVTLEGTAIFGTSAAIGSVMFDHKDNWTPEQMAQAMIMAALFKGGGKLMAGKTKEGDPIVEPVSVTEGKKDIQKLGENARSKRGKYSDADINTRAAKQGIGPDGRKIGAIPQEPIFIDKSSHHVGLKVKNNERQVGDNNIQVETKKQNSTSDVKPENPSVPSDKTTNKSSESKTKERNSTSAPAPEASKSIPTTSIEAPIAKASPKAAAATPVPEVTAAANITKTISKNTDTQTISRVPDKEQLKGLINNLKKDESLSLDSAGLSGWKVEKLPKGPASADNVFSLTFPGKDPIRLEGKQVTIDRIQTEARKIVMGESAGAAPVKPKSETIVTVGETASQTPNTYAQLEQSMLLNSKNTNNSSQIKSTSTPLAESPKTPTSPTSTPVEIGSKIVQNPNEIVKGINTTGSSKGAISAYEKMANLIKDDISVQTTKEIVKIQEEIVIIRRDATSSLNELQNKSIKDGIDATISSLDRTIIARAPKQSFVDMRSAQEYLAKPETKSTLIKTGAIILVIAGIIYVATRNKSGEVTITQKTDIPVSGSIGNSETPVSGSIANSESPIVGSIGNSETPVPGSF